MAATQPSPSPADGSGEPASTARRFYGSLAAGVVVGGLVILFLAAAGLVFVGIRWERQQLALVEDALATLAAGKSLPSEMVCADPDDVVKGLEDPSSWPVDSYEVLGISPLTPASPATLWHVDVIVNGEQWTVEVWDADAGRMSGICGISAYHGDADED